ncbi:hypothetical protein UFOVP402_44 [uncultured Caudovirales phage]|uniref:Uncharacterized protein n=1 Tax=uncultured Caudovirales phage TaxID=2100421 RepID=A0A6J5M607_9CAUD|nr:hypothetical protein UFOVP402_44 [uncultured Caudovirales phage]
MINRKKSAGTKAGKSKKADVKKSSQTIAKPRYWVCVIGETEWNDLPSGCDSPIRQATQTAFRKITGHDEKHCWSGWSADKKTVDKILKAWS